MITKSRYLSRRVVAAQNAFAVAQWRFALSRLRQTEVRLWRARRALREHVERQPRMKVLWRSRRDGGPIRLDAEPETD